MLTHCRPKQASNDAILTRFTSEGRNVQQTRFLDYTEARTLSKRVARVSKKVWTPVLNILLPE
jgi:hypothetical protein